MPIFGAFGDRKMRYPDKETYEKLYARYLKRDPAELLEKAGNLHGKTVLDICAGSGRASIRALEMGAEQAIIVDQSSSMIDPSLIKQNNVKLIFDDLSNAWNKIDSSSIDVAICQQGINYWYNELMIESLCKKLKKNGCFIFNTFHNQPSSTPSVNTYNIDGRKYVEVSYLIEKTQVVHHVQTCEGIAPHTTKFDWIPHETFMHTLKYYFAVTHFDLGKTSIYRCDFT